MLLADVVAASDDVAKASSRLAKVERLASVLRVSGPDACALALAYLAGEIPQGRIGVGWSTLKGLDALPSASERGTLTLQDVDSRFASIAAIAGRGSTERRKQALSSLFACATAAERSFLARLLIGELRQGANEGVMLDAIARAANVADRPLRRAAMCAGSLVEVGARLLTEGPSVLEEYSLVLFRPLLPMLASPAEDVTTALTDLGGEAVFEVKLDGARLQVHKRNREVRAYTRSLHDVTARIPEIVELVQTFPAASLILDGEALALRADGTPESFQVSMRRFARKLEVEDERENAPLHAYFFDVLLVDDRPLLDAPLRERLAALDAIVPSRARPERIVTRDAEVADALFARTIACGHEGLMAKSLDAPYEAGRRGASWLKLKPAHTLDLVVLAVERGSGRREGWLSNIHLGARDPEGGGFVMLGKTFKGMTDEILEWQTKTFRALATNDDGYVVTLRPEIVVEVAFNDVQESPNYDGGLALRFARVKRYRPDKTSAEASTIDEVRRIAARGHRAAT